MTKGVIGEQDGAAIVQRAQERRRHDGKPVWGTGVNNKGPPIHSSPPSPLRIIRFHFGRLMPITSYETALVRVKGVVRDRKDTTVPTCFVSYAWGNTAHERWVSRLSDDLSNAAIEVVLDQ